MTSRVSGVFRESKRGTRKQKCRECKTVLTPLSGRRGDLCGDCYRALNKEKK